MNFYKNHFGMIISSVVAICISLIMVTSVIFADKLTFTVSLLVKSQGTAFPMISLTGMIFPLTGWSFTPNRKVGLKSKTLPHVFLENFMTVLFFSTTVTLVLTTVNAFNNPEIEAVAAAGFIPSTPAVYIQDVIRDWPIMLIINYIPAFFVIKVAIKIARSPMGGLKSPHSPQNMSA